MWGGTKTLELCHAGIRFNVAGLGSKAERQRRRNVTVTKKKKKATGETKYALKAGTLGVIQAFKISTLSVGFNVGYTQSDAPLNMLKEKEVNMTEVKLTNWSLICPVSGLVSHGSRKGELFTSISRFNLD